VNCFRLLRMTRKWGSQKIQSHARSSSERGLSTTHRKLTMTRRSSSRKIFSGAQPLHAESASAASRQAVL
jgi:hypothetical protein